MVALEPPATERIVEQSYLDAASSCLGQEPQQVQTGIVRPEDVDLEVHEPLGTLDRQTGGGEEVVARRQPARAVAGRQPFTRDPLQQPAHRAIGRFPHGARARCECRRLGAADAQFATPALLTGSDSAQTAQLQLAREQIVERESQS